MNGTSACTAATATAATATATATAGSSYSRAKGSWIMAGDTAAEVEAAIQSAFMNGSYQADREAFLDRTHRVLMFMVIMFGAASVSTLLPPEVVPWTSAAAAAAGAADLLFDLSVKARNSSYLRRQYFLLAASLKEQKISAVAAQAELLRLAGEEPPPHKAAHALAENWATWAVYGTQRPLPCRVSWWKRVTRHLLRHSGHNFSVDAPRSWSWRIAHRLRGSRQ